VKNKSFERIITLSSLWHINFYWDWRELNHNRSILALPLFIYFISMCLCLPEKSNHISYTLLHEYCIYMIPLVKKQINFIHQKVNFYVIKVPLLLTPPILGFYFSSLLLLPKPLSNWYSPLFSTAPRHRTCTNLAPWFAYQKDEDKVLTPLFKIAVMFQQNRQGSFNRSVSFYLPSHMVNIKEPMQEKWLPK